MRAQNTYFLLSFLLLSSCANRINKAVSDAKYSAYEAVGLEKRDLFKREVSNVKDDQEDTSEAFKDALTVLKDLYKFDGGDLEKQYNRLRDSLDDAKKESTDLSARIDKLDKVANDLFSEWAQEIEQIKTNSLKEKSGDKLKATKSKFQTLATQLRRSEKTIAPVINKLNDQVLFLKHNLNSEAIGGLKSESGKIQADITALINEVNESTKQADTLIKSL
jgi:chromosome segregation ATPase